MIDVSHFWSFIISCIVAYILTSFWAYREVDGIIGFLASWRYVRLLNKSERANGPNRDPFYTDFIANLVNENAQYWLFHFETPVTIGGVCRSHIPIAKKLCYCPQVGDRLRVFGDIGINLHGMMLNDTVVYWFKPSEAPFAYYITGDKTNRMLC